MQRHPDFRLTVWYHGLKATQYFSKFTQESIAVLKKDLANLGLPQPKNQNISLLSHGAVECYWPAAGMNPVLHKNLMAKTTPTPAFHDTINQLSILSITVKETPASRAPNYNADLVKPSLKRPYEQRASTSAAVVSTSQDTPRGQLNLPQNPSVYRPQLAHPSAASSVSFPCDGSRPSKVAKTHAQGFNLSPVGVKPNSTLKYADFYLQKSVYNGHSTNFESSVPTNRSQASTSTTTTVNPSSYFNLPCPPARPAINSAPGMTKMNPHSLGMSSNSGSTVPRVEERFLNNLEFQSTLSNRELRKNYVPLSPFPVFHKASPSNGSALSNVRIESQRPTAAVDSNEVGQFPGRRTPNSSTTVKVNGAATQLPTPSTSAPPYPSRPNLQSTTPVVPSPNSAPLQRVQRMTARQGSTVPPTPTSVGTNGTGSSAARHVAMNPSTPQLTMDLKDVSRSIGEWFAEGHEWRKQGKNIIPDREKELEKVIEELNVVKKELEEERRSRKEDKELLDIERQRREEAENALSDVRRECRQPFVVPSLMDAFVELSKLTTRGLKVSGPEIEALVYPPRDRREAGDTSVNGHDISASRDKTTSSPVGSQRTKVKLEPLDDTVAFV